MNTHRRAIILPVSRFFRSATLAITLLSLANLLAGCGQKGPLRLPDETPVATQQK